MKSYEKYVAFKTITIKEVFRFMRIWVQTILPPVITTVLYFIIFGNLIGSRIGNMGGYTYMQFIVPGLIMMQVIINSYSNVVSSFFQSKFMRNIEEMLVSPIPNYLIVLGFVAGGVARGLVVGIAVTIVSLFFTSMHIHNIFIMVCVVVLSAVLFSLVGLINGIYARKFDDVTIVPNFVLTPLTYLGGVFYSITMLPVIWQKISLLNPILYMVNAFRYGILGVSDINIWFAFTMILVFITTFFLLSLHLLKRGVGIRD